jgi:hypothetical protein
MGNEGAHCDSTGRVVRPGDVVRILAVPDLSGLAPAALRASLPVFEHLVGTYKRVSGFNEIGQAELIFRIRKGPAAGLHVVWIETELLRVRRARGAGAHGSRLDPRTT